MSTVIMSAPRGKPRVCDQIIKEIRRLHFEEYKSYSEIAHNLGLTKKTCYRYCTGIWSDYDPIPR